LEDGFRGAQCPYCGWQAYRKQAFKQSHRLARSLLAQLKAAAQAGSGGGPEEPGGQHDSQRHFIAVEDDNELAQENDLSNDSAESYQS
jgi:hypothetical protein